MKKDLHYILLCMLVLLIQTIINNHIYTNPLIYICLIPLLIIQMPLSQSLPKSLLEAFAIGLLADILSGGVPGLNAGAAVLAAALRRPMSFITFSKGNYLREEMPIIKKGSIFKYTLYTFLIILAYFLFYIAFDGFATTPLSIMALRLLTNSAINMVLIMLISISFFNIERK